MRRFPAAVAIAACVSTAVTLAAVTFGPQHRSVAAPMAPVAVAAAHADTSRVPDRAAIGSLRGVGAIGAGLSTLDYIAVDGIRSVTFPGYTWHAARTAVQIGRRIIAVDEGPPRRCAPRLVGLRA